VTESTKDTMVKFIYLEKEHRDNGGFKFNNHPDLKLNESDVGRSPMKKICCFQLIKKRSGEYVYKERLVFII